MSDSALISALNKTALVNISASNGKILAKLVDAPQLIATVKTQQTLAGKIVEYIKEKQQLTLTTDKGAVIIELPKEKPPFPLELGTPIQITADLKNAPETIILEKSLPAPPVISRGEATSTQISQPQIHVATLTLATLESGQNIPVLPSTQQELQNIVPPKTEHVSAQIPPQNVATIQVADKFAHIENTQVKPKPEVQSVQTQSKQHIETAPATITRTVSPIPTGETQISALSISSLRFPTPTLIRTQETTQAPEQPKTIAQPLYDTQRAGETRAHVVGFTKDKNFPVIELAGNKKSQQPRFVTLQSQTPDIPVGSEISVHVKQAEPITVQNPEQAAPVLPSVFITPEVWPIMEELKQSIETLAPQQVQAFTNTLPSPAHPANINATSLFFIAAMRSGDIQGWLGEKTAELLKQNGKGDLLTRLSSEIFSFTSKEPHSAQEWRSLTLPMNWDNDIHKVVLHYRQERENSSDDAQSFGSGKTRFVMDLELSQLGAVQIDGLFIGDAEKIVQKGGRLDLILRTEQHFRKAVQHHIRGFYAAALKDTNLSGELLFQQKDEKWLVIAPDHAPEYQHQV